MGGYDLISPHRSHLLEPEAVDNININGIEGVDSILEMIKDTIDDGRPEDAKDYLSQLQDHFNEVIEDQSNYGNGA